MKTKMNKKTVIIAVIALLFMAGIFVSVKRMQNPEEFVLVNTIMVPVIDSEGALGFGDEVDWDENVMREAREKGEYIGCGDRIVYTIKEIEQTPRPLEAIYRELFRGDEIVAGTEYENPISSHINDLFFDRVIIENDIAKLYLTGEYITIGTCEPPRTKAVLIFAAKQYPWINDVEIYLNGEEIEFIHGGKE